MATIARVYGRRVNPELPAVAEYEVVGSTLLLTSTDFGDGSAELGGLLPEDVAVRLLRKKAEAAMARGGERFMRDDEVNAPETPDA